MLCIKTGFYARLPSGLFAHGDAFVLGAFGSNTLVREEQYSDEPRQGNDHLLLRICATSLSLEGNKLHFHLRSYGQWFDERLGQLLDEGGRIYTPNSTLVASPGRWDWFGYAGQ